MPKRQYKAKAKARAERRGIRKIKDPPQIAKAKDMRSTMGTLYSPSVQKYLRAPNSWSPPE